MKLRCPAIPLITHTPYFSVWSPDDVPNRTDTCHWTGKPQPITGTLKVGERTYGFLGKDTVPPMSTVSVEVSACSTEYVLESPEVRLKLEFTSPLLLDDLKVLARPVTYISVEVSPKFSLPRDLPVTVSLSVGEAVCLDHPGQSPVMGTAVNGKHFTAVTMSNTEQKVLNRAGDDVRIDWGTFYLAVESGGKVSWRDTADGPMVCAEKSGSVGEPFRALFAAAYDEVKAIQYFGRDLDPLWKEEAPALPELLDISFSEYGGIAERCRAFDRELTEESVEAGGERYSQLLRLAYRQAIAAHTICRDEAGQLLFISKECFSNGCAATADVSYPSTPLFLLYRPELVFAMMRPLLRYARSDAWKFDFAPHDAGTFPLLNGQAYGDRLESQMPVEECGNLLLMTAAATAACGDGSFADEHWQLLSQWAGYLREKGLDPENQLCTDDFAGHLAHNCNLSIKAIMGVAAYGFLLGEDEGSEEWLQTARDMAKIWVEKAANNDGTYRLAFDRPGTYSLKYNAVWDRLLKLSVFPEGAWDRELASYLERTGPYGMPLDNRASYTKSDWLVWAASMMERREAFEAMTEPLWQACHNTPQRGPFTDWYDTRDAWQVGFQNRTVQGGLFMRVLMGRESK